MSRIAIVLVVLVCSMFGAISGAVAGFYAAVSTPAVSNIAVLDIESMVSSIDPNAPDRMQRAADLTNRARAITEQLTSAGVVVLDRAHVLAAPAEAFIRVGDDKK